MQKPRYIIIRPVLRPALYHGNTTVLFSKRWLNPNYCCFLVLKRLCHPFCAVFSVFEVVQRLLRPVGKIPPCESMALITCRFAPG